MVRVSDLRYDVKHGAEWPDSLVRQLWAAHVWFHAQPCVFSLNSLILSILFSFSYVFDHREEGRQKKNLGDSRVHSHSSPPPHTASLSSPCSKVQFIFFFFAVFPLFSFCHKSKAWICSALFCNPKLASSIGDCLCAVLAPHFRF